MRQWQLVPNTQFVVDRFCNLPQHVRAVLPLLLCGVWCGCRPLSILLLFLLQLPLLVHDASHRLDTATFIVANASA